MSFKFLEGGVEELMEYTGYNKIEYPNIEKKYLVFGSNEPYTCDYFDWIDSDRALDLFGIYAPKYTNYLAIKNPKYIDMEKYISEYKHLIGCEFVGSPKGKYVNNIVTSIWAISKNEPTIRCNFGYLTTLSHTKFYTEDDELVTYEEYMELYYPEYRHVWEKQL